LQEQAYAEGFSEGQREGHKEGFERGRQEGFEAGHQEGKEALEAEMRPYLEHLEQLLQMLARPLEWVDQEVEETLVTLALAIARQVIRRELKTDPTEIIAIIRDAIAVLPLAYREVRLYLHPEDAKLVRGALPGLQPGTPWEILEDPLLTRGGCRLESNTSRIDATVENRLASVISQVLGRERTNG
jgi:flagellar assembly protein FliH